MRDITEEFRELVEGLLGKVEKVDFTIKNETLKSKALVAKMNNMIAAPGSESLIIFEENGDIVFDIKGDIVIRKNGQQFRRFKFIPGIEGRSVIRRGLDCLKRIIGRN